ncbi:unnamed protein product [Cuscuta campestris]|uniref:Uncharacterized protein n=1 Tax=Cuscuta campestris TaxID=132261 RepID=A0A484KRD8_9ASTE|nr:unnamed protein product [Cuscuta campestris]
MDGNFAPSKSRVYIHLDCSDRTRFSSTRFSPSDPNFQKLYPILMKRKHPWPDTAEAAQPIPNDVSRNLRVRRVFSPNSVIEESSEHFEPGFKNHSLLGSSGEESTKKIGMVPEDLKNGEAVVGAQSCGSKTESVRDEGLNKAVSKEGNGIRDNRKEPGHPPFKLIRPNEPSSTNKQIAKTNLLRRAVESSSSFSYRRLLPYLMGLNDDKSCSSEIKTGDTCRESNVLDVDSRKSSSSLDKGNCYSSSKNEPVVGHLDDCIPLHSGEVDNGVFKLTCEQLDKNCGSLSLTQTEPNVGLLNGMDSATRDNILPTPPDPDISTKTDTNDYKACTAQTPQQNDKMFQNPADRNSSNWKSKMVLNPCSRKKVLNPPCSVSYEQQLPYLLDVGNDSKDEADAIELKDSYPPKSQAYTAHTASEVLPANVSVATSSSISESIKNPTEILEVNDGASVGHTFSHTTNHLETDLANGTKNTDRGEVSCDKVPSSPITDVVLPTTPELSQLGETKCDDDDIQEVHHEDKTYVDGSDVSHEVKPDTSTSATTHTVDSTEDLFKRSAMSMDSDSQGDRELRILVKENTSSESSTSVEESNLTVARAAGHAETLPKDCNSATIQPEHLEKNCGDLVETVTFNESQTEIQTLNTSTSQTENTMKGVLKRNPRGCRGLCECLNCASFRLHAERSFEFTKHQMQDAEQVALELIKQLSDIRKLLGSSASIENNFSLLETAQVNDACTKALQAEQLAKERLSEMNDDLQYHCRTRPLQRPRVTFSISAPDLSACPKNITDCKRKRSWNNVR